MGEGDGEEQERKKKKKPLELGSKKGSNGDPQVAVVGFGSFRAHERQPELQKKHA